MTDPTRRPHRRATVSPSALQFVSALFAASLALPWTREEWTGQRYRGWSVLFAGNEYPQGGPLLVAAWALAVVIAVRRPNHGPAAAVAAGAVCAICPGYYGWEITRDRGWGIGQDAAGHVVEWVVTATPDVGYYLAGLSAVALLVGVLLAPGRPAG